MSKNAMVEKEEEMVLPEKVLKLAEALNTIPKVAEVVVQLTE